MTTALGGEGLQVDFDYPWRLSLPSSAKGQLVESIGSASAA